MAVGPSTVEMTWTAIPIGPPTPPTRCLTGRLCWGLTGQPAIDAGGEGPSTPTIPGPRRLHQSTAAPRGWCSRTRQRFRRRGRHGLATVTGPAVIDNGQYGYSQYGHRWKSFSAATAYTGNEHSRRAGTGANPAIWQTPACRLALTTWRWPGRLPPRAPPTRPTRLRWHDPVGHGPRQPSWRRRWGDDRQRHGIRSLGLHDQQRHVRSS